MWLLDHHTVRSSDHHAVRLLDHHAMWPLYHRPVRQPCHHAVKHLEYKCLLFDWGSHGVFIRMAILKLDVSTPHVQQVSMIIAILEVICKPWAFLCRCQHQLLTYSLQTGHHGLTIHSAYHPSPIRNNFGVVCKSFYLNVIKNKLGIADDDNIIDNIVYKPIYQKVNDIYTFHGEKLSSTFGMKLLDINHYIPLLYWTSKQHKCPYKFRFIAGASKCYNK